MSQQRRLSDSEEDCPFATVQRPWGTYTILDEGAGFKVKRIIVNPGAALSLQLHRYRSEHWVIVAGVAQVTNGELQYQLQIGQFAYVPQDTRHRLANTRTETLEVIEVQTGSYLGEDDIIRFEDLYHRVSA
jgi:mannose-1-phosphate guanylyltransferase / mannose-6-phosphate isomerase